MSTYMTLVLSLGALWMFLQALVLWSKAPTTSAFMALMGLTNILIIVWMGAHA